MNLRLIVSILAGLIVSFVALVVASRNGGSWLQIPYEYALSSESQYFQDAVSTFRKRHDRLPSDLAELGLLEDESVRHDMRFDNAGRPLDPWGKPYTYQVEGDRYEIVTLAADRLAGGIGGDADVRVAPRGEDEFRILEPPTLWQYTFEYATASAITTCIFAGVCTFLIGAMQRGRDGKPAIGWMALLISLAGVGALSACMAGLLAMYHLPFEHH